MLCFLVCHLINTINLGDFTKRKLKSETSYKRVDYLHVCHLELMNIRMIAASKHRIPCLGVK